MPATRAGNSQTFKVTTPSDRVIKMTRVFDAPRDLVFEVMNTPKHIKNWWGALGEGYSVPVCEVDFRVGGKWRFVNKTPKGEMVEFYGEYLEIDAPERVVFTEIFAPFPDSGSVVTGELTEQNGKTLLTVTCEYPSKEVRDMVVASGMEKGAAKSYDRLEEIAQSLEDSRSA